MRPKNICTSGFGARHVMTYRGTYEIEAGNGAQAKKARAGSPLGGRLRALRSGVPNRNGESDFATLSGSPSRENVFLCRLAQFVDCRYIS
jgi:hypothetical protein